MAEKITCHKHQCANGSVFCFWVHELDAQVADPLDAPEVPIGHKRVIAHWYLQHRRFNDSRESLTSCHRSKYPLSRLNVWCLARPFLPTTRTRNDECSPSRPSKIGNRCNNDNASFKQQRSSKRTLVHLSPYWRPTAIRRREATKHFFA